MATMLNGAAVMDAAILLIASNEPCPQPQTSEHLAAVEIMHLDTILILQNKIDLVKEAAARDQYDQVLGFTYVFVLLFFEMIGEAFREVLGFRSVHLDEPFSKFDV